MSPNWQNWDPDYISGSPQRKLHSQADLANEAWKQSRCLKKVDEIPDVWISGTGLLWSLMFGIIMIKPLLSPTNRGF